MIRVEQGQNVLDLAMQYCGNATAAFNIALLNGMCLTDDIAPGALLEIPAVADTTIVNFFLDNNIITATATALLPGNILPEQSGPLGIGNWKIGVNFKIG